MRVSAAAWGLVATASSIVAWPRGLEASAPPLFVYWAPDDAAEARQARDAAAEAAREVGGALVDLSPSPPAPSQARGLLERGIAAHGALRLDEAAQALDGALREIATTGAEGLAPSELSDLFIFRALVDAEQGEDARAWESYVRAATVDPARVLDPIRFAPRTVKAFERALAGVRGAKPATLRLEVPAGCTAWIDAREASELELPPGDHYVAVDCPGARRSGVVVTLIGDLVRRLDATRVTPPEARAAAKLAADRGAPWAILLTVETSAGAPPTLRMRLLSAPSGRAVAEASVALGPGGAAADARDALRKLVARAGAGPLAVPPPPPPRPWYLSPWLWGTAGAVVAAAILLPFVFDSDAPRGFAVDLGGTLP